MSKQTMVTPSGTANYPWLTRPDTTFNPDGTYQTNIIIEKKKAEGICASLDKAYQEAQKPKKKGGKPPYFENEDGDIEIKFSQKSVIRTKKGEEFKKTVAILDAKKHPCKANVGKGSTIKVAYSIRPYDYNGCGISLDLVAVQVLELVEYEGGSEFGFDEEEGFEAKGEFEVQNEINEENNFDEEADDSGDEGEDDQPF